ncbi:Aspartokinase [Rosistilla ulvae]|uniref:aspartate kinase n=1 Tax=Rosistilla ulvae TaxID=1930277 RepID=A0A517M346_9BACT|nr:aspartate kinase [Rosistilla ulvae]QDS89279.1 Aspartokinase [Rosistilla ulvae]
MSLIVQKFGGTSVADVEKIRAAARKAIRAHTQGHQVVTVVSAMGKNTDRLVELAYELNERPPAREMDVLLSTGEQVTVALMAMAIESLGYKAVSLTGAQMGIRTDNTFTKARIQSIDTQRIQGYLDAGNIVIAAGFQGIDDEFNITTLGRGGSDTTAVALAAVLGADTCEIYTDVDGVYTTDPRLLPEARRVEVVSYDEMLELASLGAGVMHNRSIEFAKKFGVPIHVRSSFSDTTGSMIVAECESESSPVCGAAMTKNEARVTILGVPDVPGTSLDIFSRIADRKIAVDMIVQNMGTEGRADLSFTVPNSELAVTLEAARDAIEKIGAQGVSYDENVSKISVVGLGMAQQTGVAHRMFSALAEAGINIYMITTSEIKISALVPRDKAQDALRVVHNTFKLDSVAEDARNWSRIQHDRSQTADLQSVVATLQDDTLEKLTLTDIALVPDQARITLLGVPDRPGIAADIFADVGKSGIFVDMIVQGYDGEDGTTSVSFTVPKADYANSRAVAEALCKKFNLRGIEGADDIAKLSVSGIGLRSHTSVGTIMFRTLAQAGVNIQMINTSELQVNVVIQSDKAAETERLLRETFAESLRS